MCIAWKMPVRGQRDNSRAVESLVLSMCEHDVSIIHATRGNVASSSVLAVLDRARKVESLDERRVVRSMTRKRPDDSDNDALCEKLDL